MRFDVNAATDPSAIALQQAAPLARDADSSSTYRPANARALSLTAMPYEIIDQIVDSARRGGVSYRAVAPISRLFYVTAKNHAVRTMRGAIRTHAALPLMPQRNWLQLRHACEYIDSLHARHEAPLAAPQLSNPRCSAPSLDAQLLPARSDSGVVASLPYQVRSLATSNLRQQLQAWVLTERARGNEENARMVVDRMVSAYEFGTPYLNLSEMNLGRLPPLIGEITSLRSLDIAYNALTALPDALGSLASLETLFVQGNALTQLPDHILRLERLQCLDASENRLSVLPEDIGALNNLVQLRLGLNQLQTLPQSIGDLTKLEILSVHNNALQSLPPTIARLSLLRQLNLNLNEIRRLPDSLDALFGLKVLECRANGMTEFPIQVCSIASLRVLDLGDNRLTAIAPEIERLQKMKSLFVDNNRLQTLPQTLTQLKNLKTLYLLQNELTCLPHDIGNLCMLRELNVSGNDLKMLPASLVELRHLRNLLVAFNYIEYLPAKMDSLSELKQLDVSYNYLLLQLPEDLGGAKSLSCVYARRCSLRSIPEQLLEHPNLRHLDIRNTAISDVQTIAQRMAARGVELIWGQSRPE